MLVFVFIGTLYTSSSHLIAEKQSTVSTLNYLVTWVGCMFILLYVFVARSLRFTFNLTTDKSACKMLVSAVEFEVHAAVTVECTFLWYVRPCSSDDWSDIYRVTINDSFVFKTLYCPKYYTYKYD
jgi:hypothetical protein